MYTHRQSIQKHCLFAFKEESMGTEHKAAAQGAAADTALGAA